MRNLTASQISWYVFSLLAIAVLGVVNLNLPFLADQSVVLTGANVIERGGALYVDFWDNKMPALFWFYWLAGKLFGFNEVGIHLFELFWLLCFSLAMMWVLRKVYSYPWLSAVAPVAVVGTYYATAGANQLTLPEFVVCFPLFLCAWFAALGGQRADDPMRFFFISGLFAGVSVTFKLIFAPLCVAFWLVAFCFLFFRENKPINSIFREALRDGGDLVGAERLAKQWIKKTPQDYTARRQYAELLVSQQRWTDAKTVLEALQQDGIEDLYILNNLANVYGQLNDPRALPAAELIYERAPENPAVLDTYGWILTQNGKVEEGLAILREAYARASTQPEIRFHIGKALASLGRTDAAKEEVRAALEQGVEFADKGAAQALLNELEKN